MKQTTEKTTLRRTAPLAVLLIAVLCIGLLAGCGRKAKPLPILMYHHVVADGEDTNSVTVTESRLREDLAWLAENGWQTVLPRELSTGDVQLTEKTVMITFDDGYRSNYEYLYPLLCEYDLKAEIAVITSFPDENRDFFMTWDMMREMADSGHVEFGSHSHALHNPDSGGLYKQGEANGVQQRRGESKKDFTARVRTDLETSFARLRDELGVEPVCFAYPFGAHDGLADREVDRLFAVSLLTGADGPADVSRGYKLMKRIGVDMSKPLSEILQ